MTVLTPATARWKVEGSVEHCDHVGQFETTGYWLLLRDSIVQNVPCNCDNFLTYLVPSLSYKHFRYIHLSSLFRLQQTSRSEPRRNWARNGRGSLPIDISIITQVIFYMS
jgi:hypothetical protein